ncbi:MAG: glucosyl-3-phosphoglycerate synthase [Candidatus Eiseniibacteriota bacterium]|nr:MAG: glucosyl-3-phosphoglycerate synthase [Candidatus Eisenbacteria bacterium]
MKLDRWLRVRTFHHEQFSDIKRLVELKEEQGLTVSVCFPTLNEEKTIGKEVKTIKSELMDRFPLLDEIAVVDSGSTDKTTEVAAREGADVYLASEHLTDLGVWYGKGENLWKSLYLLKGDIIVWVDSDIKNIHPRFVYGLLGPLLTNSDIEYVKAFYERPIKVGRKLAPTGGGRVTELVVRPVFNLLFPQLSGLAQPLSGEYAGRRSILERMPFYSGYGVEVGLLLDIERKVGLRTIAQVDLEVRVHRNQTLDRLRNMSHRILTVLLTKAEEHGKIAILEELNRSMNVITKEEDYYGIRNIKIEGTQRPPMIAVKAYQEARGIREEDLILVKEVRVARKPEYARVSSLLRENLVHLDLVSRTKHAALEELVQSLYAEGLVTSVPETVGALLAREAALSTGIGKGIAIPHAITELAKERAICVGRSLEGVEFGALDAEPAKLILLVICPLREKEEYLKMLAAVCRLAEDDRFFQSLLKARGRKDLISAIRKFETLDLLTRELHPAT